MSELFERIFAIIMTVVFLSSIAVPTVCKADQTGLIVLEHTISLPFDPVEVVFLVERSEAAAEVGSLERIRGVALPVNSSLSESQQDPQLHLKDWLLGAPFKPERSATAVHYSILIAGNANRYEFVPSITLKLADLPPWWASTAQVNVVGLPTDQLRAQLLLRKEQIKEELKQRKAVTSKLEQIRMDAEVIGNFAKILEIRNERNRIDAEADASEAYALSLKKSLERAKSPVMPSNFPRRELQLTQQIAELVRVTKQLQDRR